MTVLEVVCLVLGAALLLGLCVIVARAEIKRENTAEPELWVRSIEEYRDRARIRAADAHASPAAHREYRS